MNEEWSQLGQMLFESGENMFCPNCKFKLSGQRNCPNCGNKIIYNGEDSNGVPTKLALNTIKLKKHSESLKKSGEAMSKTGTSMTLGCTVPIIIFILIILLLL